MLTIEDWHRRYTQQARWTESVRRFLFEKARVSQAETVLEVGSGTGVILNELGSLTGAHVTGIDNQFASLRFARNRQGLGRQVCANALELPFGDKSFTITCCHFFLLWSRNPLRALHEMKRVTRPGGAVLALAEPDYGGRIDYPPALGELGQRQTRTLVRQLADPLMGRKLKGLFHQAGLQAVEAGVLGGQWSAPPALEDWESEWKVLEADLQDRSSPGELTGLKNQDRAAWQSGERVLFVPTFFAFGTA